MRTIDADALLQCKFSNPIGYTAFSNLVKRQPTIEPERETGKWIPIVAELGDHKIIVEGYNCSKCGRYDAEKDNFCPDCGARMEGK